MSTFERIDTDLARTMGEGCSALCNHIELCYAEIDRLRANALEWVTVTDDPATLPKGVGAVILVLVGEEWWHQASLGANGDVRRWRLASGRWERLSVGDRWMKIPEAPDQFVGVNKTIPEAPHANN